MDLGGIDIYFYGKNYYIKPNGEQVLETSLLYVTSTIGDGSFIALGVETSYVETFLDFIDPIGRGLFPRATLNQLLGTITNPLSYGGIVIDKDSGSAHQEDYWVHLFDQNYAYYDRINVVLYGRKWLPDLGYFEDTYTEVSSALTDRDGNYRITGVEVFFYSPEREDYYWYPLLIFEDLKFRWRGMELQKIHNDLIGYTETYSGSIIPTQKMGAIGGRVSA